MAWLYIQSSGELSQAGDVIGNGYSGYGEGRNNPSMQDIPDVGPLPTGDWLIVGPPEDTPTHGPFVLKLEPKPTTEVFGRSGFLMHGDSKEHPGLASHGCMIMPRVVREAVWNSGDHDLTCA